MAGECGGVGVLRILWLYYIAPQAALLPAPKIYNRGEMDNERRFEERALHGLGCSHRRVRVINVRRGRRNVAIMSFEQTP